jgi:bifunctional NMN adenylyltransferase/nudix hydrolase
MAKIGVVVSKFSFVTREMFHVLKKASDENSHVLLFVCSADRSKDYTMPFNRHERSDNIMKAIEVNDGLEKEDFSICYINDNPMNSRQWITDVHSTLNGRLKSLYLDRSKTDINVYVSNESNHRYENIFPEPMFNVHKVSMGNNEALYKDFYGMEDISSYIAPNMCAVYDAYRKSEWFDTPLLTSEMNQGFNTLKEEYEAVKYQKEQWSSSPFPPTFITTDAVVYHKGYVLVVKRKGSVGKGLYCLPGGFLSQMDTIKTGIVNNLKKDTNIQVHENILKSNIRNIKTYDDPIRSLRGRIITHAGLIELDDVTSLKGFPKVRKTKSQKEHAGWFSLFEIEEMRNMFFEDHYYIIKDLLSE